MMEIRISTADGLPIYLQIKNQVKYLVASGRLRPGEQLLPVRKLAETLMVNPNTIAKVYRELELAGLLVTRRGAGVFVADGGSPLRRGECRKILAERIDVLLAEARQMKIPTEQIVELIHQRGRLLDKKEKRKS